MSQELLEFSECFDLLKSRGCLYSSHLDDSSGPRRSNLRIARFGADPPSWPEWMHQLEEEAATETNAQTERDSNYIHFGWPITSKIEFTPWMESRKSRCPQPIQEGSWLTKTVSIRRLVVDIPLEAISPVPEFVADMEEALGTFAEYERFQGLKRAFEKWGDVIALGFELGTSVSITGPCDIIQSLDESEGLRFGGISAFPSVRMRMQGGDTDVAHDDISEWLSKPGIHGKFYAEFQLVLIFVVAPKQWAQIKVTRVVPITRLLPPPLQSEIESLYKRLISYRPELDDKTTPSGEHIDGNKHAMKTISHLIINAEDIIQSVLVVYWDGTQSDQYGDSCGSEHVFSLQPDEFIVEVAVWLDDKRLCGLQFVTSEGRLSQCYGGSEGQPTIYNSPGGALVAFSADICYDDDLRKVVGGIRTIWRHDMVHPGATTEQFCSLYIGGAGGKPFNDRRFLHNSATAYISGFRIRSGCHVNRIQATYKGYDHRKPFVSPSWPHGGAGGLEETFQLQQGEYITAVSGRHDGTKVIQLCFKTNRGRTSSKYGQTSGKSFLCKAPVNADGKPMRLRYIIGKSSMYLNGIMFIWGPVEY